MGKVLEFKTKYQRELDVEKKKVADLEQAVLQEIEPTEAVGLLKGAFSKAEFEAFSKELDDMEDIDDTEADF